MNEPRIPIQLSAYKRTAVFDQDTMPAGLRHMHETKGGVWGKICVIEGRLKLRFIVEEREEILDPDRFGVVCPRQAHEVEPLGPVRFFVEFYSETPKGEVHERPVGAPMADIGPGDLKKPMHPPMPGKVAPPGLDEAGVVRVVDTFYDKVRADDVIGPIFDARIAPGQWPHHLNSMYDFWSSLLLGSGRYNGRPMPKHLAISELDDEHFVRWLALFKETVEEICLPPTAALFIDRAERIAQSFRLALAFHRGEDTLGIVPLRAGSEPANSAP
jgi:hemoglobin